MLEVLILAIANNRNKVVGNKCEKHYYEVQSSVSTGICDFIYLIPTIKSGISGSYFQIEFDIFFFYIYITYKLVDTDESGCL